MYSEKAISLYEKLGVVRLGLDCQQHMDSVEVLVVRLAVLIDEKFISKFAKLRAIVTPTTGLGHIDIDICRARGIRVFSLADCRDAILEVTSTAELALGLMIALLRNIVFANKDVVEQHNWDRDRFRSRQLSRLALGVVGFGRIGGHMARYGRALNMRVLGCDPYVDASHISASGVEATSFESILGQSDIISVHASLTEKNVHLFNASAVARMKPGVLLINTARGALLDEPAVVAGLRSGTIAGVAIDVLENEHTDRALSESPLLKAAQDGYNVIVTPHIGGCTTDAMHITEERMAEYVVQTLKGTA